MKNKKPTVSLVLGSGGARGLAHIGVIQVLEEKGFDIRSISGSSMGALIGGIYAAGKLDVVVAPVHWQLGGPAVVLYLVVEVRKAKVTGLRG